MNWQLVRNVPPFRERIILLYEKRVGTLFFGRLKAGRPVQTLANPYDIVSAIQTTSGLLEAADYLETLAKNKGN